MSLLDIRANLARHKIKHHEAAALLGVSQSTFTRALNGQVPMRRAYQLVLEQEFAAREKLLQQTADT